MGGQQGREVVIVEAVRTPIGRGHPEKGYYAATHPNELLGTCYTEVIARAGIDAAEASDRAQSRCPSVLVAQAARPVAIAPLPAIPSFSSTPLPSD